MTYIHINRFRADTYDSLWCPYCDKITLFANQHYYEDWICTKCHRSFPYHYQWPKGFNIKTGKLLSKDTKYNQQINVD